jgi:nicotinamide-nucleotide amidase
MGMRSNKTTRVEVINTGTELLFGSILNRHLSYLGQQLFSLGLRIQRQSTVPDGDAIRDAIVEASSRCDLILVTGGLGPTNDDITREIVAELTDRPLYYNEAIFQNIKERLEKRGIRLTEHIARQAYVPKGATVLPNDWGTAPGLYLPAQGRFSHLFLFPGPPRELHPMFKNYATPILRTLASDRDLHARVFLVAGLGESYVEDMVGKELEAIAGLEIGYCARMGEVDLRIIGSRNVVELGEQLIRVKLGPHIVTTNDKELEEVVVELLTEKKATLAVAESCTGGLIANRITDVPGASAVLLEGNVTYSNEAKTRILGVAEELFTSVGAVSEEVAKAMAEGARTHAGSTFALSVTGIAGPDGGTEEKPVGTAYIGLASPDRPTEITKIFFPADRKTFKRLCSQRALDMLRRRLI